MQRFKVSRDGCAAFDGERLVSRRPESKSAQCCMHTHFTPKIANLPNQEAGTCMDEKTDDTGIEVSAEDIN